MGRFHMGLSVSSFLNTKIPFLGLAFTWQKTTKQITRATKLRLALANTLFNLADSIETIITNTCT
jgi:hypothetical protein